MEKKNFWSEACKYGAIIGAAMSVSHILEQMLLLSGKSSMYMLMIIEWLVASGLFIYLLYRYTKLRSAQYSVEDGFNFGQGFSFIVVMSAVSGVIVGVVGYIFLHVAIGYENYLQKLAAAVTNIFSQSGVPASMENMYSSMIDQMVNAPAPSIISAVAGSLFSYVLTGGLIGLIIAGILGRSPRPFGEGTDE